MDSALNISATDLDLIKADLLNIFYTTPGEHRMRPLFGSTLRQRIFDQYNGASDRSDIVAEVQRIVNSDPRVTYVDTTITDVPYGLVIAVDMTDKDSGTPFTLLTKFNLDSDAIYGLS